jgi:hypothetical protein
MEGADLTLQGLVETEAGIALGEAAQEMAAAGAEELVEGTEALDAAADLEE